MSPKAMDFGSFKNTILIRKDSLVIQSTFYLSASPIAPVIPYTLKCLPWAPEPYVIVNRVSSSTGRNNKKHSVAN